MLSVGERLDVIGACQPAIEYANQFRTPQEAWDACDVPEWMIWLLGRTVGGVRSKSRKTLAALLARAMKTDDRRLLRVLLAWTKGKVTVRELRKALANDGDLLPRRFVWRVLYAPHLLHHAVFRPDLPFCKAIRQTFPKVPSSALVRR